MVEIKIITDNELLQFGTINTLCDKAEALLNHQLNNWELLKENYKTLTNVEQKYFNFESYEIIVQYNPKRIISTSAKVDAKSIQERKCFLCLENLPDVQKGILYKSKYLILANPYPIFSHHFTVANIDHLKQDIFSCFDDMLELAKEFHCSQILYNGPNCGASAPDHLHFQAIKKNILPVEKEIEKFKREFSEEIYCSDKIEIYAVENYLRKAFVFESQSKKEIVSALDNFIEVYSKITGNDIEPMMNIVCSYENLRWRVIIFPRSKHRPSFFYSEDENNFMISPAVIDLGGVLITPRKTDFEKITPKIIKKIYREVTLSSELYEFMKIKLSDLMRSN